MLLGLLLVCYCNATAMLLQCFWIATGCAKACPWQLSLVGRTCLMSAHVRATQKRSPKVPETCAAWEKEGRAGVEWVDEALFRMGGSSVASVVSAVLLRVAFGRGAWPAGRELLWRDKSLHQKIEPLIPQFPEPTRRLPRPPISMLVSERAARGLSSRTK